MWTGATNGLSWSLVCASRFAIDGGGGGWLEVASCCVAFCDNEGLFETGFFNAGLLDVGYFDTPLFDASRRDGLLVANPLLGVDLQVKTKNLRLRDDVDIRGGIFAKHA